MMTKFEDFSVGDTISFKRKFEIKDYNKFADLSGDFNPLHHDTNYSITSGHNFNIVPLHLIVSPLSRIAGMNFPGTPSLYLSHKIRAINQLQYNETITYSAKVISLNISKRIMTVRVIGAVESKIIFDSELSTHATHSVWKQEKDCQIIRGSKKKRVLITGASGQIASALAKKFYDNGWSLLLQTRSKNSSIKTTLKNSKEGSIEIVNADLSIKKDLNKLIKSMKTLGDISTIIHTASPPINDDLSDLVHVNYSVLKSLVEFSLPQMLSQQNGKILFIGSTAMLKTTNGLENYAAAKSMAASYLSRINTEFSPYDIQGQVFAPDFVSTEYSKELRGNLPSLLPAEVASKIYDKLIYSSKFMTVQNVGSSMDGRFGFEEEDNVENDLPKPSIINNNDLSTQNSLTDEILIKCIKRVLPKASEDQIRKGGLGLTPGWDSLAQIQIILEIERQFEKKFTSAEYEILVNYKSILLTIQNFTDL